MDKIKNAVIPHIIGFALIFSGWYLSILNVGLTRFQTNILFTKWTGLGFALILSGAYFPEVYTFIRDKFKKS